MDNRSPDIDYFWIVNLEAKFSDSPIKDEK